MKFHSQEVQIVVRPTIVRPDELPLQPHPGYGLLSGVEQEGIWLGGIVGRKINDDLTTVTQAYSILVEEADGSNPELAAVQITGGEIVVEERQLFFDSRIKTPWIRRQDCTPQHIPGFYERMLDD